MPCCRRTRAKLSTHPSTYQHSPEQNSALGASAPCPSPAHTARALASLAPVSHMLMLECAAPLAGAHITQARRSMWAEGASARAPPDARTGTRPRKADRPGAGGDVGAVIAEVVAVVAPDFNLVSHVGDARRAHAAMLRRREGLPCHNFYVRRRRHTTDD